MLFIGIAALPALAAIVLRVNAVLLFASIAAGELLVIRFGDDAELVVSMAMRGDGAAVVARLIVLFLPVALTLLFARKSVSGSKMALHIIPILATSLLIAALTYPFLSAEFQQKVLASPHGKQLVSSMDIIVGVAVVFDLLLLWWTHRPKKHDHKKH